MLTLATRGSGFGRWVILISSYLYLVIFCGSCLHSCCSLLHFLQFDREDAIISTWDVSCPDVEEHNSRDCVALVSKASQDGKQFGALYRDLECDSSFQDFAVGVICQRGGLATSTTEASTTSTTTPTPTTTTPYGLYVELQVGSVGDVWQRVCSQLQRLLRTRL